MCESNKLSFFLSLVYFHSFLLQRWEVLMRVHQPWPPDNKYQPTKPINTVIAGARRFAGNYALWMFLYPPSKIPQPHSLATLQCAAHPLVPPNRRSKATESLSMGAGPIRGRNTQHKKLLLDQPSSARHCFSALPQKVTSVSAWREKTTTCSLLRRLLFRVVLNLDNKEGIMTEAAFSCSTSISSALLGFSVEEV